MLRAAASSVHMLLNAPQDRYQGQPQAKGNSSLLNVSCMHAWFLPIPIFFMASLPNISALPQGPQTVNTSIALATHDNLSCTCASGVEISFPITRVLHERGQKRQNATLHIPAMVLGSALKKLGDDPPTALKTPYPHLRTTYHELSQIFRAAFSHRFTKRKFIKL
jgi:hypothetical protein